MSVWEAAVVCKIVTRDNHTALYVEKIISYTVPYIYYSDKKKWWKNLCINN